VQHTPNQRIGPGKFRHGGTVQRFDDVEAHWQRRSRVPEALDHVGEIPGKHMVVGGSNEGELSFSLLATTTELVVSLIARIA
jgi:hypothetical protein